MDTYPRNDSREKCFNNFKDTISLSRSLGFHVHANKYQFLPTQELDIFGFTINSVNITMPL